MDQGRRRTLATYDTNTGGVSSLPIPSARKQRPTETFNAFRSSVQGSANPQLGGGGGGGRYSLAPSRVVSSSRQSIAVFDSQGSSSSQQQQQQHNLAVPSTVGRVGHTYGSHGLALGQSGGRSDAGFLRASVIGAQAQQLQNQQQPQYGYAPPRSALSVT